MNECQLRDDFIDGTVGNLAVEVVCKHRQQIVHLDRHIHARVPHILKHMFLDLYINC